jgi:hypothetical protein
VDKERDYVSWIQVGQDEHGKYIGIPLWLVSKLMPFLTNKLLQLKTNVFSDVRAIHDPSCAMQRGVKPKPHSAWSESTLQHVEESKHITMTILFLVPDHNTALNFRYAKLIFV